MHLSTALRYTLLPGSFIVTLIFWIKCFENLLYKAWQIRGRLNETIFIPRC
jgi:hypothetical protein